MTAPLSLSQSQGRTDVPLIEQTIGQFFAEMAARQGTREALVCRHQQRRYSYLELHTEVRRLASALLSLGLQPGDRVGIWSHNNAEWVLMQLDTAKQNAKQYREEEAGLLTRLAAYLERRLT
mgnify:CR=1 FL=1